ncbi:MAG TPA: hypothetical protein PKZ43_07210 [Bacteroidales bacterium]|nr:hypothetical protein [Bacteroidales bacterium]
MEQEIFKYPYYQTSQFLTSQDLNASFSFVEEQERLTRSKMIGSGIINGLSFNQTINTANKLTQITILPGFGVTSDGYTVCFPKASAYNYMVLYDDFNTNKEVLDSEKAYFKSITGIKYLLYTEQEIKSKKFVYDANIVKVLNLSQTDYSKYCVALVVDIKTETSFNCNPSDCNINSSYKNITYRPVFIEKNSLEKINTFFSDLDYLKLGKLTHISGLKSVSSFNTAIKTVIDSSLTDLETYLEKTTMHVADLLPQENTELKLAFKNFKKSFTDDYFIYYLSCINDIQTAINEFVNAFNNYIHKYIFSSTVRNDRMLILGEIPTHQKDTYRYLYKKLEIDEETIAANKILLNLYKRIVLLMDRFMPVKNISTFVSEILNSKYSLSNELVEKINLKFDISKILKSNDSSRIKIIPCKGYAEKLGNRSIPYYYNIFENTKYESLLPYWHAHDLDLSLDLIHNYYWYKLSNPDDYKNEFLLNLYDYPFYRIEGHVGESIKTSYEYLNNLIKDLDIPIQLIKVDIANHAWNDFKLEFDKFSENFKVFSGKISEEVAKIGSDKILSNVSINIDKIKQSITQVSYKSTDDVKKILDDINAYCNLIITPDFSNQTVTKKVRSNTTENTTRVATSYDFIKDFINEYKIFTTRDALSKLYLKATPLNEISLSEIKGLEYLGGVYKGGTFVLLHDGEKVIGDFSLPYYYSIGKDRVL